jgi:hypothetical protein
MKYDFNTGYGVESLHSLKHVCPAQLRSPSPRVRIRHTCVWI